jgi:hypothetical protein
MPRPDRTEDLAGMQRPSGAPLAAAVVVAALAAALVAIATRHGAAVSPDSATYASGAQNLTRGTGYVDYLGQSITDWPPGFPVILAGAHLMGMAVLDAARWLGVIEIAALVVLTYLLGLRYLVRPWLAVAAAAVAGFAPAMVGVFGYVWSEPGFCVIAMALLIVVEPIARRPMAPWWQCALAGLIAGVGFAVRYAGMALFVVVMCAIIAGAWGRGLRTMLSRIGIALAAACVLPVLVLARNRVHGSWTGQRLPSTESAGAAWRSAEHFLSGWVFAGHHPDRLLGSGSIVIICALVAWGVVARIRANGVGSRATSAMVPLVAIVVVYPAYIAITEFQTAIDPPDDRIFSPVFAPAALVVMIAIDTGWGWLRRRAPRGVRIVAAIAIATWVAAMLVTSAGNARDVGRMGMRFTADGFTLDHWAGSAFMDAVSRLPADARIYSNQPGGIYLATGRQPVRYIGEPLADPPVPVTQEAARIAADVRAASAPSYLAWSEPNHRPHLVPPAVLAANGVRVTPLTVTPQGTVYRLEVLR